MITSIELQVISKILTTEDSQELNTLCGYDSSYYSVFKSHIEFILDHYNRYGDPPDVFTFQAQFPDITLVAVSEPLEYLQNELKKNKQHIILLETFNKLKDLGSGDISEAWQYLSNQCEAASKLDDSHPVDIVKEAEERSNRLIEFNNQSRIPTGFKEIDKLMYGGLSTIEELVLIIARTNTGKAQPLWSKVLTPGGWKTMGDIELGDVVVGKHNDNGRVIKIFPQGIKDYYRVHFDDNTYVECCDDHLWEVLDSKRRQRSNSNYGNHLVLTTKQLRNSLDKRYSVDISQPINFDTSFDETAELDPYLLGVLLGDGGFRDGGIVLSTESEDIWHQIDPVLVRYNLCRGGADNYRIVKSKNAQSNYIIDKLKEYGLMGKCSSDKFIPKMYLTAPVHIRQRLLSGLVDTDGYISKNSKQVWEFDTSSEQLALDFANLARSLGVKVKMFDRQPSYYITNGIKHKGKGTRHLVCRSEFNPFIVTYKASKYTYRTTPYKRSMPKRHAKFIQSIEYIGKTECQCILLDNISHTYITDNYTVTHNSWFCIKIMESAQANGFPVLYYSPEMQSSYIGARFDTWRKHFKNSELYQGKYTDEYKDYIHRLSLEGTSAYVLEDKDMPSGSVSPANLRTLVQKYKIKLLVIDGLDYLTDSRRSDNDYVKYKNLCLDLFKLSKEFGCAVVVAAQANRETRETKDDKGEPFPSLYNVAGSDHPGRICTQAFALRQIFDKHVLDIRLEKSRSANNQRPVLSYSWDPNTGTMEYIPDDDTDPDTPSSTISIPAVNKTITISTEIVHEEEFDDGSVEF